MAGIVSATAAQAEEARRRAEQFVQIIQKFSQGSRYPTKLNPAQITETDAAVDALVAALAPLNT